ncbi:MAG: MBL fold metallo-hydrolase [Planctomycetota bacterium]|jgi:L-ascorbate metabolism protein UlaG (beta-lactamase superfamily)|nr:MBL fold metallo-hydrolase [Planctomycetota bacterium]
MGLTVTALGNAGVRLENAAGVVYIDPLFHFTPGVGGRPHLDAAGITDADLILVTHAHGDHLDPVKTLAALARTGAVLVGPESVTDQFRNRIPSNKVVTLEPPERQKPPARESTTVRGIGVAALRTYHGRGHNSYLLEMDGIRILHDADNERTQPYDLDALGKIDALFLCPWQGSGAGQFVDRLKPGKWLLIHMTEEEIALHRRGRFLPPIVDPAPESVVALYGGESIDLP